MCAAESDSGINYAVGIPTRGRSAVLWRCVIALFDQVVPPSLIVIVDNNDEKDFLQIPTELSCGGVVTVLKNLYRTPGPEQGHQTALRYFDSLGIDIGVRWDDDLVPNKDCMGKLVRGAIQWMNRVGKQEHRMGVAVGGMYPRDGEKRMSSATHTGDGNSRHVQFFRWEGEPRILKVPELYSSFAYHVPSAVKIGGFCVDYSQFGYRGETDFTKRLAACFVDTTAVAVHYVEEGGTRSIPEREKEEMGMRDYSLFVRRMLERKLI